MTGEGNSSTPPPLPPNQNSGNEPEQPPDLGKATKSAGMQVGGKAGDGSGIKAQQLISKRTLVITAGGLLGMVLLCGFCGVLLVMLGVGSGSVGPVQDGDGGGDTSDELVSAAAAKREFLESVGRVEGKNMEAVAEFWLREVEKGRWTWEDMDNILNAYAINSESRTAYRRWREAKDRESQ